MNESTPLSFFTDNYHIPRQYIEGLDKAPKPGKKK